MTQQHYDTLKAGMAKVIDVDIRASYETAGLSRTRFAWDALYASVPSSFICKKLYKYLDDSHIEAAILRIVGEC